MAKEVTLDSSVLVSVFVKGDKFRPVALRIMERVFLGEYRVVTSVIVPVEVCGVISRRAGVDRAVLVKRQLDKWENMNLIGYSELSGRRRRDAAEIAVNLKLRGMDAIVVQVAKEKKAALLTFDKEMAEKSKVIVEVLTLEEFEK